ncbi:wnt inhibitory factor 1-like [Diadema setosum]|uniref:wnt inhibitory factor 1-like n=1 Tax=Diadema setosum TaxID=31175 RepID=UPI003B3B0992
MAVSRVSILAFYAAALIATSASLFTDRPAVDMWLSRDEVSRILGQAAEPLYIIREGLSSPSVSPLILDQTDDEYGADYGHRLVLPSHVNFLKISWRAPKPFHYSFMELRSSNPSIMAPPLLSITLEDSMPTNNTEFRIDFPCTGERSGTTSVSIIVRIQHAKSGRDIPASPIHITFDKKCIEAPTCEPRCANGGVCNQNGRCDCPPGFYGQTCRIIFCIPHCYNSGTCIAPGVCACPPGFIGNRCQKAICRDDCSGNGYCYKPGFCYCYHGWTGAKCDQRKHGLLAVSFPSSYRSKNLRLVKNRRLWGDST